MGNQGAAAQQLQQGATREEAPAKVNQWREFRHASRLEVHDYEVRNELQLKDQASLPRHGQSAIIGQRIEAEEGGKKWRDGGEVQTPLHLEDPAIGQPLQHGAESQGTKEVEEMNSKLHATHDM